MKKTKRLPPTWRSRVPFHVIRPDDAPDLQRLHSRCTAYGGSSLSGEREQGADSEVSGRVEGGAGEDRPRRGPQERDTQYARRYRQAGRAPTLPELCILFGPSLGAPSPHEPKAREPRIEVRAMPSNRKIQA